MFRRSGTQAAGTTRPFSTRNLRTPEQPIEGVTSRATSTGAGHGPGGPEEFAPAGIREIGFGGGLPHGREYVLPTAEWWRGAVVGYLLHRVDAVGQANEKNVQLMRAFQVGETSNGAVGRGISSSGADRPEAAAVARSAAG